MRSLAALLLCLCLCLPAHATDAELQRYHALRSNGYLLAANALIHFNPENRTDDPRNLRACHEALERLQALAAGGPESIRPALARMQATLAVLQRLPREESPRYPALLIDLLDSQRQLDANALAAYTAAAANLPATVRLLHRQSLALGELLLNAQARNARTLGDHSVNWSAETFVAKDARIEADFAALPSALPDSADQLNKHWRTYRFTRPRLLASEPGQTLGGEERYLSKIMRELDRLAVSGKR